MKVAALLSGGVDSSVALHLLARQRDVQVQAFYLKIWLEDELAFLGDCPWEEDLRYARAVCQQLDIPLEVIPLQTEYRERIVEHALAELRAGRTPSPDIFCNERIKFGVFMDRLGGAFDRVASGHYAQIAQCEEGFCLQRAPDPVKDQTYFLSNLHQEQLAHLLFPIGHLPKLEVRTLAQTLAVPSKDRKDSQGICFLGKINYRDFVAFHLGRKRGNLIERETGEKKGEHEGYWFHTIGQRHGLGLGGGPWYVVDKDAESNTVFISHSDRQDTRMRDRLTVSQLSWITGPPTHAELQVKLRHGPQLIPCHFDYGAEGKGHLHLQQPDPGIAPGQHAVLYDGEYCLGGGIID